MIEDKTNGKYDDIIALDRPISKSRSQMSLRDRAAQFAPFAALVGYESAVKETARLTERMVVLSEEEQDRLNEKLYQISLLDEAEREITVTHFVPDQRKTGGEYVTQSGVLKKIDSYQQAIILVDKTVIPLEYIRGVENKSY